MARNLYGCTSADFTLTESGRVVAGATATVWTARTGGTQITDLTDLDGDPITSVTSDADGGIRFYGVDGDKDTYWLDTGTGARIGVRPTDLTGETGPTPDLSIGTVNTGTAAATFTGTAEDPVLNLTLPSAGANGVNTAAIQDDAVTAAKIAANAVGASELADNAVNVAALDADDLGNGLVLTADSGEPSGMKWSAYGIADLDIGTVDTGTPAAASMTGNPQDGYALNLTLPPVGNGSISDVAVAADADIDPTKIDGTALTEAQVSAAGDLFVGTGDGTVGILPTEANGLVLTTDDGEPTGMKWGRVVTESPRGGQRPTLERKPTLTIDQVWPNAIADFRIVWADASTLYAVGPDTCLRKSLNSGKSWTKLYYAAAGPLASSGLFFKTAAGSLITTLTTWALPTTPKIMRSVDDGATWTDVVATQTDVSYLGPTSIAQDPITGYLYLVEYVTASAATKTTWKIMRSVDDGATWTAFHTFQRDAASYPTSAVRHGHCAQWDPVAQRMWFSCGDGENAAGLYRVNAAGDDVEPVLLRSQLAGKFSAGAVGLMFFPNYIAWGNDQRADHGLIRVARSELGEPTPAVELVAEMQSTSFYTVRLAADNNEWLMTVSNETGSTPRLDNAMHVYRVADDAATVDEVLTMPISRDDGSFTWIYPVPGATPLGVGAPVWMVAAELSPIQPYTGDPSAVSFRARLVWGGQSLLRPDAVVRRPYYQPVTVSSGYVSLPGLRKQVFAVTEVPARATSLYILETTREQFVGQGFGFVEVCSYTMGGLDQTLGTGLTVDANTNTVTKTAHGLAVDTPVRFAEVSGVVGVNLYVTYYIASRTDDTFTVAATPGGPVIDITTGGTATIKYDPLPVFTPLQADDGSPMSGMWRSRKSALNEASRPWLMRSSGMPPGTKIAFRMNNNSTPGIAEVVGTVTYAWGFNDG